LYVLFNAFVEQMLSLEAQDGEDDCAGVDGGEGVAGGDDVGVQNAVLFVRIVAAEADDGPEGQSE